MMRSSNLVKIAWVFVDGEPHHVSEYASLARKKRPVVFCMGCAKRLVLRLGPQKAHHAAHYAKHDPCKLTQPESALHHNAKCFVYQQLVEGKCLIITRPCQGVRDELPPSMRYLQTEGCKNKVSVPYIADWDQVKLESALDEYRPDIVLYKDGQAIGAIEILVSHAVEPDKAETLKKMAIPWIEVNAVDVWNEEQNKWKSDKPIPYKQINEDFLESNYLCDDCRALREQLQNEIQMEYEKQQRIESKRKEYQDVSNHQKSQAPFFTVRRQFRLVDFYRERNRWFRAVIAASYHPLENYDIELSLSICNLMGTEQKSIRVVKLSAEQNTQDEIEKLFKAFCDQCDAKDIRVNSRMPWLGWDQSLFALFSIDKKYFPPMLYWHEVREWWVPIPEMADISWDMYWENRARYLIQINEVFTTWEHVFSELKQDWSLLGIL